MSASVRPARLSDAASLGCVRSAAIADADRTERTPQTSQAESSDLARLIEEQPGLVHVADSNGSVVGYLALQRAAHPAVRARSPIQLWQLYVVRPFHGTGVAAQLMSAALEHARTQRHDVIWLGVSQHNVRAMTFYRKQGFEALGLHEVGSAGHAHQDVVMLRAVR